nr:MAG TPA: hypothetical protein [Caudoviricetes sp.]
MPQRKEKYSNKEPIPAKTPVSRNICLLQNY